VVDRSTVQTITLTSPKAIDLDGALGPLEVTLTYPQ